MKTARAVNHSLILQALSCLPSLEKNTQQKVIVSVHIPSDKPNRISGNCPELVPSPL